MDLKRRKLNTSATGSDPVISTYASNLRKTKVRIRRNARKKERSGKENIPKGEGQLDEVMEEPENLSTEGSTFTFRAGSGKRTKMVANGSGGWPLSAIKGECFDHVVVFHIDPIGSDHHVLLVDSCFSEEKSIRSFKFEAIWMQHDDFLHVVREGWLEGELINADGMRDLLNRLAVCRRKLQYWSRGVFPNFRKVIDLLRHQLNCCMSGVLSLEKLNEAEILTRQIEEAWASEESYCWKRSMITWLNCGDKNTKFFHNSVIQRRQRNKVLRLKMTMGSG
ncbi:hypothetical protein K1719_007179 [Acacia pycnantha]|nr:hypothetical protein K1719_007179 [Acacia pycnantha]